MSDAMLFHGLAGGAPEGEVIELAMTVTPSRRMSWSALTARTTSRP